MIFHFLIRLPFHCVGLNREGAQVWIEFGSVLVSLWFQFGVSFGLGLELVLESFWTCFGFRFCFGSNLDWDWGRLAPSLISDIYLWRHIRYVQVCHVICLDKSFFTR